MLKRAKLQQKHDPEIFKKWMVFLWLVLFFTSAFSQNQQMENETYLVPYRKGDKWGYAELHTGKVLVPPVYDKVNHVISCAVNGFMQVWLNGKTGAYWVNAKGEVQLQIPVQYDFVFALTNTSCQYHNKALAIDSSGTFFYEDDSIKKQFKVRLTRAKVYDKRTFNHHYYPEDSVFSFTVPMQFKDAKYEEYYWGDDQELHQLNKPMDCIWFQELVSVIVSSAEDIEA